MGSMMLLMHSNVLFLSTQKWLSRHFICYSLDAVYKIKQFLPHAFEFELDFQQILLKVSDVCVRTTFFLYFLAHPFFSTYSCIQFWSVAHLGSRHRSVCLGSMFRPLKKQSVFFYPCGCRLYTYCDGFCLLALDFDPNVIHNRYLNV